MSRLPARKEPCPECPWRKDTPPGQFSRERYEALEGTHGAPGAEAPLNAPWFACHKSQEDTPVACAGWLAVEGLNHLAVRFAAIKGEVPGSALRPGDGWPELHESYRAMAEAQGG